MCDGRVQSKRLVKMLTEMSRTRQVSQHRVLQAAEALGVGVG